MIDKTYKVSLLASENVGKKTLANKILNKPINEIQRSAIGVDFSYMHVEVKGSLNIMLQIWIHNENERFKPLLNYQINGAFVIILMYDITNIKSFNRISEWIDAIKYHAPILLVGNKLDLEENREVPKELVEKLKKENNISDSMEISLQTGENVEKLFKKLTEVIEGEEIDECQFSLKPMDNQELFVPFDRRIIRKEIESLEEFKKSINKWGPKIEFKGTLKFCFIFYIILVIIFILTSIFYFSFK